MPTLRSLWVACTNIPALVGAHAVTIVTITIATTHSIKLALSVRHINASTSNKTNQKKRPHIFSAQWIWLAMNSNPHRSAGTAVFTMPGASILSACARGMCAQCERHKRMHSLIIMTELAIEVDAPAHATVSRSIQSAIMPRVGVGGAKSTNRLQTSPIASTVTQII